MKSMLLPTFLLLAGAIVYWLFRTNIYLLYLFPIQNSTPLSADNIYLYFLKNYFSDLVWCIALTQVALKLIEAGVPKFYSILLLSMPISSEILQATGLISGTFDWLDLLIYLAVFIYFFSKRYFSMKNFYKHIVGTISVLIFSLTIMACLFPDPPPRKPVVYTTGVFTIQQKKDEIFTKPQLSNILKSSKNLSMVLRVPNPGDKVTEEQKQANSVLYNLIEKEFAKAGFIVRDRLLFAKVLEQETKDYSKIGLITETDLILELLTYTTKQPYKITTFSDSQGSSQTAAREITFNGAMVEFKLISVKQNDMVGSYTFYYTPCTQGCTHRFSDSYSARRTWKVEKDIPKDFFVNSSRKLIKELKVDR
ncbi:hypothetical protein [Aliikangiella coralliicola]|uniref:Uncharacterized protein n=1 Tax=Aliikangiella coralliicola TaxID=2592383 RepID=A0A545TV21_9GAMM|nr:hypothetical protein [Aliikangiella coralliicola]TQV81064.1 hypothetical protein FLL46_25980 [Aliikangiella coralliicola]